MTRTPISYSSSQKGLTWVQLSSEMVYPLFTDGTEGRKTLCLQGLWKNETHLLKKTSFPSIYRLRNHSKYTIPFLQLSTTHFPSIDKLPCQGFLFKSFLNKNILKDFHY